MSDHTETLRAYLGRSNKWLPLAYEPDRADALAALDALASQLAETERERDYWKKQCEDQVRRKRVTQQRLKEASPALPAGSASERSGDAKAQLAEARKALEQIASLPSDFREAPNRIARDALARLDSNSATQPKGTP